VWNPRSDWVISGDRTQPAPVGDADFLAVQQITALAVPADGRVHRYQLTGLLVCRLCGRRLEGHWVNRRPGYRCRHGHTTAQSAGTDGRRWLYWSQTRIAEHLVATGNKDLAGVADAGDLAARLRARDALIVCGPDTVAVDQPPSRRHEADVASADDVQATGQLALPMPTRSFRTSVERNPGPDQWIPRPRRETTEPPSRSIQNVNDLFGG
jgi:hypothetical protein